MPFKKRYICAEIALILSSGLLLASIPHAAQAQLPQFSCRANESGDGWICESDQTPTSGNTVRTTTRPLSNRGASTGLGSTNRPERQRATPTQAAPETTEQLQASPTDTPTQIETPRSSETTEITAVAAEQEYELDWVPLASLSPEQLAELDSNCCGVFVDPSGREKDAENRPADAQTRFDAAQGVTGVSQNLISIDGDIVVQQGYRTIQNNESTSIDRATNTVIMQGDVVFREPGVMLAGSSAFIDNDQGGQQNRKCAICFA